MSKAYENGVLDERRRINNIIDRFIQEATKPVEGDFAEMLSKSIIDQIAVKVLISLKEEI